MLLRNKSNNLSILLFHGVIKSNKYKVRNYNNKHITEKKFTKILKYLKRKGKVFSMDEVVYNISKKKKFPPNSYSITFDDGFENNYSIAAPILDDLSIPTTFYFSTDFIENNSMSWIDQIEYCFEENFKMQKLEIKDFLSLDISTKKKKIIALNIIRKKIKSNHNINVKKFVKKIFKYFKIEYIEKNDDIIDKKISWKKTKKILDNDNFILGGHSHVHMPLTYFSQKECFSQINKSIFKFKKNLNLDIEHYSYPEGTRKDFNLQIIKYLKNKKIKCSPTALNGYNSHKSNLFLLKRNMV